MKKILLAGVAALAIAGSSTGLYAQQRQWFQHERTSAADMAAYADARIASVHAGLQLTPEQEKLWPPLEDAVREFAKLRIDRTIARNNRRDYSAEPAMQQQPQTAQPRAEAVPAQPRAEAVPVPRAEAVPPAPQGQPQAQPQTPAPSQAADDPVERLRARAERMATTAAVLKRIVEAADPLYKTLDEGQKRRLAVLTQMGHRRFADEGGWRHRIFERGMDRGGDRGLGYGWDRGLDREGGPYREREYYRDRGGEREGRYERHDGGGYEGGPRQDREADAPERL